MRQIITILWLSVCLTQLSFAGTMQIFALITLDEAVRNIIREGQNKVLATRTETIDGRRFFIIKVLTPEGRIQHVKIDAGSDRNVR